MLADQVGEIIRIKSLKTNKALYAFAKKQANEGKTHFQTYLYKHPNAKQNFDLISTMWRIEEPEKEIMRNQKECLKILPDTISNACVANNATGESCNGLWLQSVLETLQNNNISRSFFSELVVNSLKHDRGKGRNLMICDHTNCAKSFILMPITKIFKCFMAPQ